MTELIAPCKSGKIFVDVFGVTILCITSDKQMAEFEKYNKDVIDVDGASTLKSSEITEVWHNSKGASIKLSVNKESFYILMLRDINHVTAAHESVHMSGQILEVKGVPISNENDEIRAYLTGYIFESLCGVAKLKIKR